MVVVVLCQGSWLGCFSFVCGPESILPWRLSLWPQKIRRCGPRPGQAGFGLTGKVAHGVGLGFDRQVVGEKAEWAAAEQGEVTSGPNSQKTKWDLARLSSSHAQRAVVLWVPATSDGQPATNLCIWVVE